MMKLAVLAAAASSAAAFAPAQQGRLSTAVNGYENELGVIAPTGFFDPLGFTDGIDQEKFDQYRTAELKHGRVAQLAVIGYITPEIFRWGFDIAPGIPCADVPNGVAAINAIPALGWAQIIFAIGAVDVRGWLGDFDIGKPDLKGKEEERALQELQHGRLAMLAILELLRHDSQNFVSPGFDGYDNMITGLPFIYGN
mmetsp:Transcript_31478/g.64761  ORF Transcript_31478/g.64761 Transcript_31478/m.64761 type:complete len:197 (+) Transcript_31478:116-706(+)